MIKVSIVGATGYTGGELLRLLLRHTHVEIIAATSTRCGGTSVSSVHRDLVGETDLCFSTDIGLPDVLFLCLGHGLSREFLDTHAVPPSCRIIDLGNDFRIDGRHGDRRFVYGLPEADKSLVAMAENVANPGCFATAIQLALLPLVAERLLRDEAHITAITGSTGSGMKPVATTHFSYRDNNVSIYKNFSHQHLGEMRRHLARIGHTAPPVLNFVPMRGNFSRGIFASVYTRAVSGMSEADYRQLYEEFYASSPFVFHSETDISLKEVVNTNKGLLHVELHDGYVHIASAIDNLLKGASGQAVQNMNLLFGLSEAEGLRLKASVF